MVQKAHIADPRAGHANEGRDVAPQIKQGMQLDTGPAFGGRCPVKQAQAQIDRAGVDGVDGLLQLHGPAVMGVQRPGDADEMQRKVFEDAAVASLIGIGQRGAGDRAAKACVVQLGALTGQAHGDVAQAGTTGQLGKHHAKHLAPVRERERRIPPRVARHALPEHCLGEVFAQLRQHQLAFAHGHTSQMQGSVSRQAFRVQIDSDERPSINHSNQ